MLPGWLYPVGQPLVACPRVLRACLFPAVKLALRPNAGWTTGHLARPILTKGVFVSSSETSVQSQRGPIASYLAHLNLTPLSEFDRIPVKRQCQDQL